VSEETQATVLGLFGPSWFQNLDHWGRKPRRTGDECQ